MLPPDQTYFIIALHYLSEFKSEVETTEDDFWYAQMNLVQQECNFMMEQQFSTFSKVNTSSYWKNPTFLIAQLCKIFASRCHY